MAWTWPSTATALLPKASWHCSMCQQEVEEENLFIYKKQHTQSGAVIGLAAGCLIATAAMLLWNYALTPIYSGMPREAVAAMLLPVFLPFNLLKGSINGALTVLLYKHIVKALRAAKLVPPSESGKEHKSSIIILIASAVVLALCIVAVLFIRGIL